MPFSQCYVVFKVKVLPLIYSKYFSTVLRCNPNVMNCTHFDCTVQCVLINFMFIDIMVDRIGFNFVFQCLLLISRNAINCIYTRL